MNRKQKKHSLAENIREAKRWERRIGKRKRRYAALACSQHLARAADLARELQGFGLSEKIIRSATSNLL